MISFSFFTKAHTIQGEKANLSTGLLNKVVWLAKIKVRCAVYMVMWEIERLTVDIKWLILQWPGNYPLWILFHKVAVRRKNLFQWNLLLITEIRNEWEWFASGYAIGQALILRVELLELRNVWSLNIFHGNSERLETDL